MIYPLDQEAFLLLTPEEINIPTNKRYSNSPFPYISNLDKFRSSVGDFNEELEAYGIPAIKKFNETQPCYKDLGTHVYLAYYSTKVSRCNKYLKRQYTRLKHYRMTSDVASYWKLSWTLMCRSWSLKVASLNSWKPLGYKSLKVHEIHSLFKTLVKNLELTELQTKVQNVWIERESPKKVKTVMYCKERLKILFPYAEHVYKLYIWSSSKGWDTRRISLPKRL